MLNDREKFFGEGNFLQSWPWKQNGTTVVVAVIIPEYVNNWRSVLPINILKKKLDFEPESASVTGKVCYHYNSWVSGVYTCGVHISHKLRRKNISDWVIMWIKFKAVIRKSQNKALKLLNFKHSMESSNPMYKEMQILKLEDELLQNNCLFVYEQLQKASRSLLIIIFTKLQTTIVIIQEVKLNVTITKSQPMAFNQSHQVR